LTIVNFMSVVFSETRAGATQPQAYDVLKSTGNDDRSKLDKDLMAAWLNFASGSVNLTTVYDGVTFAQIMSEAEATRNNPSATSAQLKAQQQRVHKIHGDG
jgi:hypothetical protein